MLYFRPNKANLYLCALLAVSRLGSLGMVDLILVTGRLTSEATCSSYKR